LSGEGGGGRVGREGVVGRGGISGAKTGGRMERREKIESEAVERRKGGGEEKGWGRGR